jgi:hypothetical protein
MYGSPIYGADVSGSLTDQDVNVSVLIFLLKHILVLLLRISSAVSASCFSKRILHSHMCVHACACARAHTHTHTQVGVYIYTCMCACHIIPDVWHMTHTTTLLTRPDTWYIRDMPHHFLSPSVSYTHTGSPFSMVSWF